MNHVNDVDRATMWTVECDERQTSDEQFKSYQY